MLLCMSADSCSAEDRVLGALPEVCVLVAVVTGVLEPSAAGAACAGSTNKRSASSAVVLRATLRVCRWRERRCAQYRIFFTAVYREILEALPGMCLARSTPVYSIGDVRHEAMEKFAVYRRHGGSTALNTTKSKTGIYSVLFFRKKAGMSSWSSASNSGAATGAETTAGANKSSVCAGCRAGSGSSV